MAQDRGRLVAALASRLGDIDLAEEALSEASVSAVTHWRRGAVPDNPEGWLLVVARRKALDVLRRRKRFGDGPAQVARLLHDEAEGADVQDIPDERLRLIFTCCHPALDAKSRIALTLRLLGGLTTSAIARAFLDTDSAMGQRLSRAKAKIAAAGIPFAVPGPEEWPQRLDTVLDVILLIFNAGYVPPEGDDPGRDLCEEAVFLARLLDQLIPGQPELKGALAFMLLTHARRTARCGPQEVAVPLDAQDPALWDAAMIAEGQELLASALSQRDRGPFQIKAAIQALHLEGRLAGTTDWPQIALLYRALGRFDNNPVVQLNGAVALAEAGGLTQAIKVLTALRGQLDGYQPYHAALAEMAFRNGQAGVARMSYQRAIDLAETNADRAFLQDRLNRL